MAMLSYVGLVTSQEKRAFYMAIAEGVLLFGVLIGQTINGFIIDDLGLDTMAYITAAVSVLPVIVASVFVTDATSTRHRYTWRDVITLSHMFDAFKTIYRKREGHKRKLLSLCFVMYSLPFVSVCTYMAGSFLYFVKERGITMSEYSIFNGYSSALKSFGGPLVVYLLKRFINPDQFHFAMGCAVSQIFGFTLMSIDIIPDSMWIGVTFIMTQTAYFALIRNLQTTICDKNEYGQLFAFDAILQCVLQSVVGILAKEVYTASLSFWPGLFLALCAFFYLCGMMVTIAVAYYHDKDKSMNTDLHEDE